MTAYEHALLLAMLCALQAEEIYLVSTWNLSTKYFDLERSIELRRLHREAIGDTFAALKIAAELL